MDPVQALAILSIGAFITVLVTALFYVFTVRPRLLEPVSPQTVPPDETLREEISEQHRAIDRLNLVLTHHTEQLTQSASTSTSEMEYSALSGVLAQQTDVVRSLARLLDQQSMQLNGLDARLSRQEVRLDNLSNPTDANQITDLIQAQANSLVTISSRLDEWSAAVSRSDEKMLEHARILAELDREIAAQAQATQRIDAKVNEQATIIEKATYEIGQILQLVGQLVKRPAQPRPTTGQEQLIDIKGIGPVYASKLHVAGIHTFRDLAEKTPEEIQKALDIPDWRLKRANIPSWIEQAKQFAEREQSE